MFLCNGIFYFFATGWVARSPVPPPSPTGEVARRARRGLQCSVAFCSAAPPSGANLLQTCHLRGLPGPGPRVTFWPARKSPKSRLREGGFRFPPSLKDPFPLKRPRPGAAAPALDPPPRAQDAGPVVAPSVTAAPCQLPHRGSQGCGAHQGSGSGKRSRGQQVCTTSTALLRAPSQRASGWGRWGKSSLYQTAPELPPCRRISCRSTVLA